MYNFATLLLLKKFLSKKETRESVSSQPTIKQNRRCDPPLDFKRINKIEESGYLDRARAETRMRLKPGIYLTPEEEEEKEKKEIQGLLIVLVFLALGIPLVIAGCDYINKTLAKQPFVSVVFEATSKDYILVFVQTEHSPIEPKRVYRHITITFDLPPKTPNYYVCKHDSLYSHSLEGPCDTMDIYIHSRHEIEW